MSDVEKIFLNLGLSTTSTNSSSSSLLKMRIADPEVRILSSFD